MSTVCSRKSTKLRSSRQKSTRKPAQIPFKISNADAVIEDSSSCITEVDDAQIHIMPLYSTNWLGQIGMILNDEKIINSNVKFPYINFRILKLLYIRKKSLYNSRD